ncbi:hypothetical protein BN85402170 [Alteracholeplasma palmae J233]|uniref:Uncharacterized protein n=1 Tax=Alteracholeplasma palmae (strain ATCC 49389 / J233) TaxID=1318466 RepID=U4KJR7_ALTPJ|nr:DUF3899 domain-containing protein [Alteracholeplasma palmae]CCV63794.1 hypothetical protein BN85402170 [Alteracholeplasma palmae J233]
MINYKNIKLNYKKIVFFSLTALILVFLGLLFQNSFTFLAWVNSFTLTTIIFVAYSWFQIVINHGLFDTIIYGVKSFWGSVLNRKIKEDLYEYRTNKEKIPKSTILFSWSFTMILVLITIILYIIYYAK